MYSLLHELHDQVAAPSSLWHLLDPDMKTSHTGRAEPQLVHKQGIELYCPKAMRLLSTAELTDTVRLAKDALVFSESQSIRNLK